MDSWATRCELFLRNLKYIFTRQSGKKGLRQHIYAWVYYFVTEFHGAYDIPTIVTNRSNICGPFKFLEKLIRLIPLSVYVKSENVCNCFYLVDYAFAIDTVFHDGKISETSNVGGLNECKNIDIVKLVVNNVNRLLGREECQDIIFFLIS